MQRRKLHGDITINAQDCNGSLSPIMSRRFSLRRSVNINSGADAADTSRCFSENREDEEADVEQDGSGLSMSDSSVEADHGSDTIDLPDDVSLTYLCEEDFTHRPRGERQQGARSRISSTSSTKHTVKFLKKAHSSSQETNIVLKESDCSKARSLCDISKLEEVPETSVETQNFLLIKCVRPSISAIAISQKQQEQREASLGLSPLAAKCLDKQ